MEMGRKPRNIHVVFVQAKVSGMDHVALWLQDESGGFFLCTDLCGDEFKRVHDGDVCPVYSVQEYADIIVEELKRVFEEARDQ